MSIERRVEKAEERLNLAMEDERITLDFGDGQVYELTGRELSKILREVRGRRHFPGGLVHA